MLRRLTWCATSGGGDVSVGVCLEQLEHSVLVRSPLFFVCGPVLVQLLARAAGGPHPMLHFPMLTPSPVQQLVCEAAVSQPPVCCS